MYFSSYLYPTYVQQIYMYVSVEETNAKTDRNVSYVGNCFCNLLKCV